MNHSTNDSITQHRTPRHPHPGLSFENSNVINGDCLGLLTHHICTQGQDEAPNTPVVVREWGATLQVWQQGTVAKIALDTVYHDAGPAFSPYEDRPSGIETLSDRVVPGKRRDWTRGKVDAGFSKDARRRMMRETGKLDRDVHPYFVTLTWADDNWADDPEQWKAQLRAFKEKLKRHWPNFSAMWRLELKIRKSGARAGEVAPHVHLIIWPNIAPTAQRRGWKLTKRQLYAFRSWLDTAWVHGLNQCKAIYNRKGVTAYIGKYVAKADDEQTVEAFPEGVGRLWGKWGEDGLPMSDVVELTLTWWEGMAVMRAFKRMANITEDYGFSSLSCFVDTETFLDGLDALIDRELAWMAEETPLD